MMQLTERISYLLSKAIKKEKRFSQVELAQAMDVAPASVNKWLSCGGPALDKLPKLCEYMGITPNELFDYHEDEETAKLEELVRKISRYPKYRSIIETLLTQILDDISKESVKK